MTEYRVVWEIDIEAESPEAAAQIARDMQREAGTSANTFNVTPFLGGDTISIDINTDGEF